MSQERGSRRPLVLERIVGGSVLAEQSPYSVDVMLRFRGVEILDADDPEHEGPVRGPYRVAAPGHPRVRPVVIWQPHALIEDEPPFHEAFHAMVAELVALEGSPAPKLLHAFGREGRVHAVVMEDVDGLTLDRLVDAHEERGEPMPVPVALTIAHALVPLWQIADDVRLRVDLDDVLVTRAGNVRVLPRLASVQARQVVGAAILDITAGLVGMAPEQLAGARDSEQSAMYTLGMLLYEMLVGRVHRRLRLRSTWELLSRIRAEPLPPVETLRHDVAPHVARLVTRATAHDPSGRFASWRELSACLAAVRSTFDPVGPEELATWARALLPTSSSELPDVVALGNWRRLPHAGLVPVPWPERAPSPQPEVSAPAVFVDPGFVYPGMDRRPMVASGELYVDARPVTAAEYERFASSAGLPSGDPIRDEPCTLVTFEQAEAYARWAGKRLPTDEEWATVVRALGPEALGVGEIWEWTSTPQRGGHVVRGGRWRDVWDRPPVPENRSQETTLAVDVGFRCVMDIRR